MLMWSFVLVRILLRVCLASGHSEHVAAKSWQGQGTLHNLEEIIIGRCYNYIRVINPTVGEKNCSAIWEAFQKAFVYKDPCNVSPTDYEAFIRLAIHKIPQNKALFWENTKLLVHRYADRTRRMMPLGDTLIGLLADDLDWCGQLDAPGINFQSCPSTTECENNPVNSFWIIASETYAKEAEGIVSVMLNGSISTGTFPKNGFFAEYELPNWNKSKISEVRIWIMDNINGPDRESCGTGTVEELEEILRRQHFNYSCIDNVRTIRILECVDFPNDAACTCI
ncbi:ADP-ribosyl cyclase/cyclic ADP-ribose hydrolase 2-like [Leucoraja erinacea]|uniref:ADP-ribosyl cyclase/cyclic ADP-ribose hydrolase 2-like n=1 Tax=Leucoraja erinaceus TaxID=7782 RepID=UPI002453E6E6|nr:ADP-ribosyl cyclase/cyclic ADP-ribose hydrolase 2-like [Leucoraja erinacea]